MGGGSKKVFEGVGGGDKGVDVMGEGAGGVFEGAVGVGRKFRGVGEGVGGVGEGVSGVCENIGGLGEPAPIARPSVFLAVSGPCAVVSAQSCTSPGPGTQQRHGVDCAGFVH